MRVLLTGASGFIGRAILPKLIASGHELRIAGRSALTGIDAEFRPCDLAQLDSETAHALLAGVDAVINAAGHAHAEDAEASLHFSINRDSVLQLAQAAALSGARFIQISSIKALGAAVAGNMPEEVSAPPADAYGRAKFEAEAGLRTLIPDRHVILRPALVVGPGAKGNLARLLALARLPMPLPFASVHAPRAMISRSDVALLVLRALDDAAMAGNSFTLADPEPLGLAEIITSLRAGQGRRPGLFAMPPALLQGALRALGRMGDAERLFSPLVASPRALSALGWKPVEPIRLALQAMAAARQAQNPAQHSG